MKLSLVIPCYNESQSLESFSKEVFGILDSMKKDYDSKNEKELLIECIFVNDGSKDDTLIILKSMQKLQQEINEKDRYDLKNKLMQQFSILK